MSDYNFKVRYLDKDLKDTYTKGKIYSIVDGILTFDDGVTTNNLLDWKKIKNLDELLEETTYKFELISEDSNPYSNPYSELDYTKSPSIHIYPNKKNPTQTVAILKLGNEIVKRSISRCYPEDTYDFNKGAEVALNRLMGREVVEDVVGDVEDVNKSKVKEVKEVKRVKRLAEVGEYIEIVDYEYESIPTTNGKPDYKIGDILRIVKIDDDFDFGRAAYYEDCIGRFLYKREYVVLEGYDPNSKTENIVKSLSDFSDKELIEELKKRLEK